MRPALLILTDTDRFPDPVRSLAPLLELLPPRSAAVVVRDRALDEGPWLKLAESLRDLTDRTQQLLIVGAHAEHAARVGAFGVHLPSGGASPRRIREETGLPWVSRAHHDVFELGADDRSALSAVLVSPVMAARKGRAALGLPRFSEVVRELSPTSAYALGGVGSVNIAPCFDAGACGVAMIEAAFVEDPDRIAQALYGRGGAPPG